MTARVAILLATAALLALPLPADARGRYRKASGDKAHSGKSLRHRGKTVRHRGKARTHRQLRRGKGKRLVTRAKGKRLVKRGKGRRLVKRAKVTRTRSRTKRARGKRKAVTAKLNRKPGLLRSLSGAKALRGTGNAKHRKTTTRKQPRRQAKKDPMQERAKALRAEYKAFADVPMMNTKDVQQALAGVKIRNGKGSSRTAEKSNGYKGTWTVVRTGTAGDGTAKGYVRGDWVSTVTGEKITTYNDNGISWARRGHGKGRVTIVVNRRDVMGKGGKVVRQAGTRSVITREALSSGTRTSVHTNRPDGWTDQRTTTKLRDGRVERFTLSRADGIIMEQRIRSQPNGSWREVSKTLKNGKIKVEKYDSKGLKSKKTLSHKSAQRLMDRLTKADANPKAAQTRYSDGTWSFKQVKPSYRGGYMETISARGKGGKLGAVNSGYVSWLGTRFGEVREVKVKAASARKAGAKKVKTGTYSQAKDDGTGFVYPDNGQTKKAAPKVTYLQVSRGDRQRLNRSLSTYNKITGQGLKVRIDKSDKTNNASINPHTAAKLATFGAGSAMESRAAQIGVLAHEGKHQKDARAIRKDYKNSPTHRAGHFNSVGSTLARDLALLESADSHRHFERRADTAAGKVLGQARKKMVNKKLTPRDTIKGLAYPKGTPNHKIWTPYDGYDRQNDRSRTTWKAYGKELRKK